MFDRATERSTVVRLLSDVGDRLRTAVDRSTLGHIRSNSSENTDVERQDDTDTSSGISGVPERALANSSLGTVSTICSRTGERVQSVASHSRLSSLWAALRRYAESSFGYRWLTTEPDPEVIVIDLRETRTVGPVIRVVDRTVRGLEERTSTSIIVDAGRSLASIARARPIRVGSAFVLSLTVSSLLVAGLTTIPSNVLVLGHLLVAGIATIGLRSQSSLEELLESRLGRTLTAAFGPPEPPASSEEQPQDEHGGLESKNPPQK